MSKTADNSEINRLRKELVHARQQIAELQEDLEEKTNLYVNAIRERDLFKERVAGAKQSITRVEEIVQSKVNLALEKERIELGRLREENQLFKQRMELIDQEKDQMAQREKQLMDKIQGLTQDLAFYARNVDARESMKRIEALRDEKDAKERHITKLTVEINELSNKCEDLMAENRTLRNMAHVPANYGINLEQVKLHDREKIDDYKKLIRVLQEDNYKLEEERARLKHMLKQQSMMYKQEPSQRYKGLNDEQIFKVDQYVLRLLSGETEEPADFYKLKKENENLKAQLEALNSKGFEFVKSQIEYFFKEKGFGDSSKALEKLLLDNEELRRMIKELLQNGISMGGTGTGMNFVKDTSRFRPPVPNQQIDGDIASGFSYKFNTHLEVVDRDGRPGIGEPNRYDVACLQLQLQENLELIKRKDENLLAQQNEIEMLYKRVRDYLLVQDQLYKDFVKMEKDFNEKQTKSDIELRNAKDQVHEEQLKVKNLEGLVGTLQKGNRETIEARLIELTKQNSILDINLLRLSRKYQTLEEQEQLLRRAYHNKEADLAEKDLFVQDRINKLKEWKARAIQQLKFLFGKLRLAVPLTEYQSIQSELEIYKHKNADLIDRNSKMAQKMSQLQTKVRENMEAEDKLRNLQEFKDDLENELEVITKRLEQVDSNFKWEMAVFNKIVAVLKRVRISPQQAFEEFDINKDGKLTRDEFIRSLDMMKIHDLSAQDIDVLMHSIDVDSDGYVQYKEFVRKLARHGVRSRTSEEQIIYLIIEALKRSRVKSMSDAFEVIDKEGRGSISREDFRDIFKSLNVKIAEADIDKFIDHFWKDKVGGIDYQQFLRIFNRYEIKLEEESKSKKGPVVRVPEAIIRLKHKIYREIHAALTQHKKTLRSLFSRVDIDQSNEIEVDEFNAMFQKMNVKLTNQEVEQIFHSVDFDLSGKVTFPEFSADFEHFVNNDIQTLIREEKEKANTNSYGRDNINQNTSEDIMKGIAPPTKQQTEMQLQTRIAILESREKQLARKLETAMRITHHAEQAQHEMTKNYDQLEKKWHEITEQYHYQKERINELEEEMRRSIRKEEAEHIKDLNEQLATELTETKAAMLSYKNMTETIADQTKGLKLILERKKDENENLINALRELQSNSIDQQRIGKLHYIIMLSRWQEAACNQKYDMILTENKQLRSELINSQQQYQNKEYDHHECENTLQEKQLFIEKLKQQIANTKNLFLTIEKAEELNKVICEITDEKTELEEHFFKLRTEFLTNQLRMDEAEIKAEHASELLETLQKSKQSELSDKVIEVSEKIRTFKLEKLRATRETTELREKNTYLSRLMKNQVDQLKKLEEQVSEFESRMHKREEEFRRADNERMRRFFNARFDDIPGALEERRSAFRDTTEGFSPSKKGSQPLTMNRDIYEMPAYIAKQESARKGMGGDADAKLLENKVKKLQEELKNAAEKIRTQENLINRFKEWQLTDKYLSEDEQLREAIDKHSAKSSALQEQESKEMAEAAYQTIKTMQEMLDQKNEALRTKEEQIDKLRKQMLAQREQDAIEIARLTQQLSLAAGSTLNKLQEIVTKHEAHGAGGRTGPSRYDRLTREELQKALDEKDHLIQELRVQMKGLEEEKGYLNKKKEEYKVQVIDLEAALRHEQQQNEVKANRKELDRLRKDLKEKEAKNENLMKAIDKLNDRMIEYEKQKSNAAEDINSKALVENTQGKKLKNDVEMLRNKNNLLESSKKLLQEQINQYKIKEQGHEEELKKFLLERDEARKALQQTRDRMEAEMRHREKIQIELNSLKSDIKIGNEFSQKMSYDQLIKKNKELENDIIILKCKQQTVVVYNKEAGTFEYIGEPIFLNNEGPIADIEDFINRLRQWLAQNERLTVRSIFESLDKQNFGELPEAKFDQAMSKIGVKLRPQEKQMIRELLDPKDVKFIKYRPLLRALEGIPQIEFMPRELLKVAKLVESRDLDRTQFASLIDPTRQESMSSDDFQRAFAQIKTENFSMTNQEVDNLFKIITKAIRTVGVTISINRLSEKVYQAVDALLIEKIKDLLLKSRRALSELFQKHDSCKQGFLNAQDLENLLLDCQIVVKPNLFKRLIALLNPPQNKDTVKISLTTLRAFFLDDSSQTSLLRDSFAHDIEPSRERNIMGEDISSEEIVIIKSAARKILGHCHHNLLELLQAKDIYQEGVISREDVKKMIEEQKVPELTLGEVNLLMLHTDRSHKGFVSITNFIEKLQELAMETKIDAILRRFANTLKHARIVLKDELLKFDISRSRKLDKKTFVKAMKQLSIALTEDEIEQLFGASLSPDQSTQMDILILCKKVENALKTKAMPTFLATGPKAATAKVQSKQQTGAFENWEAEKKYKKKLEALQQQIEESKKETQAVEKQAKHWQEMSNKLEKEKNMLQARLVDLNAKPPKAAMYESLSQGQLEQMQGLKDQLFYFQEENQKLERTIQVELRAELGKAVREKEKFEDKYKAAVEESKRLENQVNRLIGKPMDNVAQREEGLLWRERRIQELEEQLEAKEREERESQEALFKAEEKILDLKFEKENFDLQFSRLQKRITDLEQYKLQSSKYSAVQKKNEEQEMRNIEETSAVLTTMGGGASSKNKDTVKIKSKSTKSVLELEELVESLKRVIEKLKTDNDKLKKQMEQQENAKDKLRSEKLLRQKIESLEQEVHNYEMKDVNLEEKDKNIKKMLEANKDLREKLSQEVERYRLLETKYKDLLIKYNVIAKEHAKLGETLFHMNTGGQIGNYSQYLSKGEEDPMNESQRKTAAIENPFATNKRSKGGYDNAFEDVF